MPTLLLDWSGPISGLPSDIEHDSPQCTCEDVRAGRQLRWRPNQIGGIRWTEWFQKSSLTPAEDQDRAAQNV